MNFALIFSMVVNMFNLGNQNKLVRNSNYFGNKGQFTTALHSPTKSKTKIFSLKMLTCFTIFLQQLLYVKKSFAVSRLQYKNIFRTTAVECFFFNLSSFAAHNSKTIPVSSKNRKKVVVHSLALPSVSAYILYCS